jgi:hypothetical protein
VGDRRWAVRTPTVHLPQPPRLFALRKASLLQQPSIVGARKVSLLQQPPIVGAHKASLLQQPPIAGARKASLLQQTPVVGANAELGRPTHTRSALRVYQLLLSLRSQHRIRITAISYVVTGRQESDSH